MGRETAKRPSARIANASGVWQLPAMVDRASTSLLVARALQLAEECSCLEEIRTRLLAEGYFNVASRLRLKHVKRELVARLRPR